MKSVNCANCIIIIWLFGYFANIQIHVELFIISLVVEIINLKKGRDIMEYRLINFSTMKVIKEFETLREMVIYFNTEFIDDLENVLMQEYNFKHKRFESIL